MRNIIIIICKLAVYINSNYNIRARFTYLILYYLGFIKGDLLQPFGVQFTTYLT